MTQIWFRRGAQLLIGLTLYAFSIALVVHPALGSMPWDVLSQGLTHQFGWSLGTAVLVISVGVLLCWIPLRQKPGIGTIANVIVIGVLVDPFVDLLALLPTHLPLIARVGMMLAGIVLNGLAGALYIGSRLGPGPRDGLMTGLVARTGGRVALVRGGIEVTVVLIGWALGGTVGVGTVLYGVSIGAILQWLMPRFEVPLVARPAVPDAVHDHHWVPTPAD
ncbi:hypothetical protein [Cellulomonas sp. NPDC089187]|uniref:membrane protein YczE n=1 Tax=Cellulomonas sp. NPDC089187 TaxID=3154970 RepID=UPI003432E117